MPKLLTGNSQERKKRETHFLSFLVLLLFIMKSETIPLSSIGTFFRASALSLKTAIFTIHNNLTVIKNKQQKLLPHLFQHKLQIKQAFVFLSLCHNAMKKGDTLHFFGECS